MGNAALAKAGRRLLPVMAACYFFAYLDRTNLGVASLTMNHDVGLSPDAYGLGAGLLFAGYVLLDVPSNLILHRVGARRWMFRIMATWGVVAAAGALTEGAKSFYLLRFLLGVAEAGFFPGMILYLTYWFPADRRARITAQFMIAVPLSSALGSPLSGLILRMDGLAGLHGWQWLFILEGVPSVAMGFLLLRLLPDRPADARWLTGEERAWITANLAEDEAAVARRHPLTVRQSLVDRRVLTLALIYFAIAFGLYGLGFWMPQIIKASLRMSSDLDVSLLTAVPYVLGAATMVLWGRRCDRGGHRVAFAAAPMAVGGATLAASAALTGLPWVGYAGLCVCAMGIMAAFPAFWALPSRLLAGTAAAGGIAVINSIGNIAGFVGAYWVGWMTTLFGSGKWGLVTIGLVMLLGGALLRAPLLRRLEPGRATGEPPAPTGAAVLGRRSAS
jgi:MFS family permease